MSAGLRAVPKHEGPRVSVAQARARIGGCEIAIPASAANLGPGFDAIAVALQLYLRVRVCEVFDGSTNGLTFDLCGTPLTGENYIERAFRSLADAERLEFPSLSIEVRTDIPMKGGLGSSAAATVAGPAAVRAPRRPARGPRPAARRHRARRPRRQRRRRRCSAASP